MNRPINRTVVSLDVGSSGVRAATAWGAKAMGLADRSLALTRWARRTDRRLSLMHRWIPRSLLSGHARWRR